jgi:hypothetical protein
LSVSFDMMSEWHFPNLCTVLWFFKSLVHIQRDFDGWENLWLKSGNLGRDPRESGLYRV